MDVASQVVKMPSPINVITKAEVTLGIPRTAVLPHHSTSFISSAMSASINGVAHHRLDIWVWFRMGNGAEAKFREGAGSGVPHVAIAR
jgi:hypothetical protein